MPESNDEDPATIACGSGGRRDAAARRHLTRQAHRRSRQAIFDQIHTLREAGTFIGDIARQTGFGPRSIRKWLQFSTPPERRAAAPKPCSPNYFLDYVAPLEGRVRSRPRAALRDQAPRRLYRQLLPSGAASGEVAPRRNDAKVVTLPPVPEPTTAPTTTIATVPRAVDPATGWTISPIVAASRCIKPRGLLTPRQAAKVDALKNASADFTAMRRLAMRFRGILRSKDIQKFGVWLDDAQPSGIYAMQRFARTVRRDLEAVTNALTKGWSNGQTEGHINRLKTLKRAMYGRAGAELLRARMLPLHSPIQHGK